MNETITGTSVLLPAATIDFFLKDQKTAEAARALSDDWRFARISSQVKDGDIETAISFYEDTASPSLVVIETDTTDDSFVERLEALSAYCNEGTAAIITGPVNDVDLYRKLASLGVSDYLVNPVPIETLSEVIAKTLIEQIGASDSRLVSVVGAKGGVGTTSIAQALATALSVNLGQKTLLLDGAGGWSSLSVQFGFDSVAKISEATRAATNNDMESLQRLLTQPNEKLSILASGSEAMLEESVDSEQYERLIDLAMTNYPVVLVDLSSANSSLKKAVINKSSETLLITTPTLSSLRPTRTIIQEIKTLHDGDVAGLDLLINKVGMVSGKEVSKSDIEAALDYKPSCTLAFDPNVFMGAETEGKQIHEVKGGDAIIHSLLPFAEKVTGEKVKETSEKTEAGLLGQVLNKIKK